MRVSDFHFDLPEELIAQHPPAQRGASRMLVLERESGRHGAANLRDAWFRDLPEFLRAGDLLVLNDSRVIPARLFGRRAVKPTSQNRDVGHLTMKTQEPSGEIEVLLTELVDGSANVWHALVKPGRKVRVGERLEFFDSAQRVDGSSPTSQNRDVGHPVLTAEVIGSGERGERTLRFAPVEDFHAVLARIGHMPLPPYIRHGQDEAEDRERYQTVYAKDAGSAAAPTAGLHFTPEMLDALRARGVEIAYVTLHVGLGTFQPVRVEKVEDVRLHAERYTLPAQTADALQRALRKGQRIIAVGTTTTRTLEHVALEARKGISDFPKWAENIAPHSGETSIFIAPGHRFQIVSGLLTNFHLPQSTLLMLVSAFAADRLAERDEPNSDAGRRAVLAAYAHAVREQYRFYSYGDCMLLL
ncbi:MAG TPA: tRNA preQ1(34) S-adenosylmethionine ribosyltransferase-isomerase QueA [Acidobacteriaceae bacterium]|nr:tRNA preQ1(34) S-adenosylmethionine ribosyltransferase-isomerase QueA [Acidobacteriaceae bacterium]